MASMHGRERSVANAKAASPLASALVPGRHDVLEPANATAAARPPVPGATVPGAAAKANPVLKFVEEAQPLYKLYNEDEHEARLRELQAAEKEHEEQEARLKERE